MRLTNIFSISTILRPYFGNVRQPQPFVLFRGRLADFHLPDQMGDHLILKIDIGQGSGLAGIVF